jgi:hypothetical protein
MRLIAASPLAMKFSFNIARLSSFFRRRCNCAGTADHGMTSEAGKPQKRVQERPVIGQEMIPDQAELSELEKPYNGKV